MLPFTIKPVEDNAPKTSGDAYLDVLCIDVSISVQQQADDCRVAGQHGPVQCCVLVIFVAKVDRHVEGQEQPGGVHTRTHRQIISKDNLI